MKLSEEDYLAHYGILRKSGRYPWGSGGTQSKRNQIFLDTVAEMKREGMSYAEIAKAFSTDEHPISSTQLIALKSIATNEERQGRINMAVRLKEKGMSNGKIAERMGLPNESSVRSLLAANEKRETDILQSTADMLRKQVAEKTYIDVGTQVEKSLPLGDNAALIGIADTKFKTALAILKEEGYQVHTVPVRQLGTGKDTKVKVLCPPGTSQKDAWMHRTEIRSITDTSKDGGETWQSIKPPISVSSKRVKVVYGDEGGDQRDGLIFVRPGVKDLSMGKNRYAQVRIAVDGSHYLKGMAVIKDDLPPGADLVFHTNKKNTGNKLDAMKGMKDDPDNPFGSSINRQILELGPDGKERVTSAMNMVYEEGKWDTWSKSLPSQMLSKQSNDLIKKQLEETYKSRREEFEKLSQLTHPLVKKKLLESFSDETDSAAVDLAAVAMKRQATRVIMPIPSMRETEIYAPSFNNGERVALVRFPHGGTFEIPQLTVNNRQREAKGLLGNAIDAVGISHKVAERLSGADFDGDSVLVIPNPKGDIKSTPPLQGLKGFDPRGAYPPYDGMKTVDGGIYHAATKTVDYGVDAHGNPKQPQKSNMQHKMGDVSNLITDMTIRGANEHELARAVRHSMVVIDCEKHMLDHKSSYRDNGIPDLKRRYQGVSPKGNLRGASTLISRATSDHWIDDRALRRASEGGPIDRATGKKVFVPTGKGKVDPTTGERVPKKIRVDRLSVEDDAHVLVSDPTGTPQERIYANHSNRLKALGNEARKTMVAIDPMRVNRSAKQAYSREVDSLNAKLNLALKNAPRERQAQVVGNAILRAKRQANPNMSREEDKKVTNQALSEARHRTGAQKDRIQITQSEWDAIQAGAISNNKLEDILRNTDIDVIRDYATPKNKTLMTSSNTTRARAMAAQGYTQAEIASALGVSLTTLKTALAG